MPLITMPRTSFQGVVVPKGWKTRVPEIEVVSSDPRVRDIVTVLMRRGATRAKAEEAAVAGIEAFFVRQWRTRVGAVVASWAKKYADGAFGSLEGLEPELIARVWVPGAVGGAGGAPTAREMKALFAEMRG